MTASAISRVQSMVTACLCVAVLAAAWFVAPHGAMTQHPSPALTQHMSTAYAGAPTSRPCSFAHLSKNSGTCASLHHVGLGQWAADQIAPPAPKAFRLPLPASFMMASFFSSRLDRPPRA